MTGQSIVSMFSLMGCFAGIVLAGVGGFGGFSSSIFSKEVKHQGTIKGLAAGIIVCCILVLGLNIFGMCIICTYGSYFGVQVGNRRGRTVIMFNETNGAGTATLITNTGGLGYGSTHAFQTQGGFNNPGTTDASIRNLQEQNRLLQEQLRLQQELNQQRNQQFGPPPPPSYGFSEPAYPPYAPPPSYDKVM